MENKEIHALTAEELKNRLATEQEAFERLRFAHAVTPIENPMRLRAARRLIARLHTAIRTKELANN